MPDRPEPIEWPNGARVAVTLTVALEYWEGPYVETGYHDGPPVAVPDELLKQGYKDMATLSWQEYGGRRGMPRLLEIVNRYGVPVTTVVSGLAVERYPSIIKEYHASGHEICSHSWAQDLRTWMLDEEGERDNIKRCTDIIQQVTGEPPVGWISPSAQASPLTTKLLYEAGYRWHGDYSDDDIPYFVEAGDGRLVAIPYQYDLNDLKVYVKGMNHAGVYVEWFKQKFDTMYREGERSPGMVNGTVHAALYGRPFGSWAVEEVIRYARGFSDVWFASRKDIADWFEQKYG
jgi:peptidoglycan/xylan/chitin deacetylase (PgdA/CDA1 family)